MATGNGNTGTLTRTPEAPMTRWTPMDEFTQIRKRMDDLFNRAFGYSPLPTFLPTLLPTEIGAFEPDVEITNLPEKVVLHAALPGFLPKDIKVETTEDTIRIEGERKPIVEKNEEPGQYGWASNTAMFKCFYSLPAQVEPKKVVASFKDGVLSIELPKTEIAKTKAIKVDVKPV